MDIALSQKLAQENKPPSNKFDIISKKFHQNPPIGVEISR
jgi:hypothetical protein